MLFRSFSNIWGHISLYSLLLCSRLFVRYCIFSHCNLEFMTMRWKSPVRCRLFLEWVGQVWYITALSEVMKRIELNSQKFRSNNNLLGYSIQWHRRECCWCRVPLTVSQLGIKCQLFNGRLGFVTQNLHWLSVRQKPYFVA